MMTDSHRETILIVDDQEENIRIVGSVLTIMNYDIIPATSAEQALKRLGARTPDIILLDVMMPETDGIATCAKIKSNPLWAEIPIIFLSAADDKNLIVEALEAGGVDYITKPFNRAELLTRVRTHLSLKQARDSLQRLAEDKDELLGILAHDMKNGLAGIQLSASMLQERDLDIPTREATLITNVAMTADRLLSYMKHFLANQRAEQLSPTPELVDPKAVMEKVVSASQAAAQCKDITLSISSSDQPVNVMADPEALRQIFENLVSNAIKFTPQGGQVNVTVENPTLGLIRLRVADTGPGFSADDLTKLFRRYQRLSARPTGNEPSTGLGLSIVKRLLSQMHGEIKVSPPTEAGGAELTVKLPIHRVD